MPLVMECDGCACRVDGETEAKKRGRLDVVVYCPACASTWDAYLRDEKAQRVALITVFEAWRGEALRKLKQDGALPGGLKVLPDEWLMPGPATAQQTQPTGEPDHGH